MALPRLNAVCFLDNRPRPRSSCSPPSSFPEARPSPAGPAIRRFSAIAAAGPGPGAPAWTSGSSPHHLLHRLMDRLGQYPRHHRRRRCAGMTLNRMPLTVWSWLVARCSCGLASALLLAALDAPLRPPLRHQLLSPMGDLVAERHPARHGDGSPLLWLHLFWFFGHPEVYIAVLPGMGITSSLLANFSRRPVLGLPMMSRPRCSSACSASVVWGHHMFVCGMNPYAGTAFGLTTMAIAVPSSAEVLSWLGTAMARRPAPHDADALRPGLRLLLHCRRTHRPHPRPARARHLPAQHLSSSSPISISSWPWPESSPSLPESIIGIPLMTGRLMNETARQTPLLDFPRSPPTAPSSPCTSPDSPASRAIIPSSPEPLTSLRELIPVRARITWFAFLLAAAHSFFFSMCSGASVRGAAVPAPIPGSATTLEWVASSRMPPSAPVPTSTALRIAPERRFPPPVATGKTFLADGFPSKAVSFLSQTGVSF